MYLTKIELQGFKSFANRTVIDFPEPVNKSHGITAIVGPNGSGKSNIVDAVRWVLGEQSTKTLRGKKSEDIIFSGSKLKSRLGMAEVCLYIDNKDKQAPIDYDEIVITRRVYRDGESEYILNKNKIRLFDILMLLAKANVGQKSYSIISQGMITQIINSTPIERKQFFDEATGIKQYQIKRDQAVNKLKRVKENLVQSAGIVEEIEPRLRLLKRQAKKLEQRKTIEEALLELQSQYYSKLWQNLEKEHVSLTSALNALDIKIKEYEKNLSELDSSLEKLAQTKSRVTVYNQLQKEYNEILFEKNSLSQELATLKAKTNVEYGKLGKQNLSWLEVKEEELEQKIKSLKAEIETLNQEMNSKQKSLGDKIKENQELQDKLKKIENDLLVAQKDDNNNIILTKHHIRTLMDQKQNMPGIIGIVSEMGTVAANYAVALEVAAGSYGEAIIVENTETAKNCIEFLRANRLGTATFLPLDKIKSPPLRESAVKAASSAGAVDLAINLIDFDAKFKEIFQYIFKSTVIVKDIESAKNIGIGYERMVTLAGDLSEMSGVMKGGFRRYRSAFAFNRDKSDDIFLKEIDKLEDQRLDVISKIKNLEKEINQYKIEIEISKSKINLIENNTKALNKEKEKISLDIRQNKIKPKDRNQILNLLSEQKEKIKEALEKTEKKQLKARKQIDEFNQKEEEKKNEIFNLQGSRHSFQTKLNEINGEYNQYALQLTRVETKKEDLVNELVEELGADYNTKLITEEIRINAEDVYGQIQKYKEKLSLIGGIDPEIMTEYVEVQERYDFLTSQIADLSKALKDTENIIKELDKIIKVNFDTGFKKINASFNKFFNKLFGGGKAKLELVQYDKAEKQDEASETFPENSDTKMETAPKQEEKENMQNMGIEIIAAPMHKKIKNLNMLSGGEKTMTAIALICAIIAINKPPFIILDEVEAALDEANSFKFASILHDLAHFSQFVIITHNRTTMHSADIMYGVAMGVDGISKILSLNISEAEKQTAKDKR